MKEIPKLWKHQQDAVDYSMHEPNIALFYDVGTGKTPAGITILRHRFNDNKRYLRTLILGPIAILRQWKDEFDIFSRMDQNRIHAITEKGKKRVEKVEKIIDFDPNQIIIMNYEALLNDDIYKLLQKWKPEVVVCDESHMLKNYKAKRSKKVKTLAEKAKHTYLLTGTPILQNTMDIFMQYLILDNGLTFGTNFFVFRNKYFRDENANWSGRPNHFPKWVPKEEMYDELKSLVFTKALRASKKTCIDLPDLIKKEVRVGMSPDQAKAYKSMERDFVAFIEADHEEPRSVIAQLAVTKSMKLLQIASGFVYDDDKKPVYFKAVPKLKELENILEQIVQEHKVIIWGIFKPNIKMICDLLTKMKIKHVKVDGSVDAKEKAMNIKEFETNDEVRVIVGNQAALGTGVNLKQASYSIYYSKDYSYGKDEQSEARNYRGGSIDLHEKVTRIDLITEETKDEQAMEVVLTKANIAEVILDRK